MHRTDKYSQRSSIIWLVWLNGWVFIYEVVVGSSPFQWLHFKSHKFLYSAYADETTLFKETKNQQLEFLNTFDTFSLFSSLKINKEKSENADIGVKNGVKFRNLKKKRF